MKILLFIIENKATILPFIALIYSEVLSLNPNIKSNGLVQLIGNLLKRKEK